MKWLNSGCGWSGLASVIPCTMPTLGADIASMQLRSQPRVGTQSLSVNAISPAARECDTNISAHRRPLVLAHHGRDEPHRASASADARSRSPVPSDDALSTTIISKASCGRSCASSASIVSRTSPQRLRVGTTTEIAGAGVSGPPHAITRARRLQIALTRSPPLDPSLRSSARS